MSLICTGMRRASEGPNPESFQKALVRYWGARQGCGPNEGIGGVLTVHCFGHQSGRGERSGGLGTAKIHDFSARVFLDRAQKSEVVNISTILGQKWGWGGNGLVGKPLRRSP